MPSGCMGVSERLMVSSGDNTPSLVTPNEYTLLVLEAATNKRAMLFDAVPSLGAGLFKSTMSVACGPTRVTEYSLPVFASSCRTVPSAQLLTKRRLPPGATRIRYGRLPVFQ